MKTAATIKAKNPNHWREIGAIGGRRGTTGGFAAKSPCVCDDVKGKHHKAQCAGVRGGRARGYTKRRQREVINDGV